MTFNNVTQPNLRPLRYPLTPRSILNLSFEYYIKDLIMHLIPFIIIAIINFVINFYVIDVLLPTNLTEIENLATAKTIDTQALIPLYEIFFGNLILSGIINSALLTIPMTWSVALVKNRYNQENKSYIQILAELLPLYPKLIFIGTIFAILMYSGIIVFVIGIIATYFIFSIWFSLTFVIIISKEDKEGFFSSLKSSKRMVSGRFFTVFGTLFLIGLIQFIFSQGITILTAYALNPASLNNTNIPPTLGENFLNAVLPALLMALSGISIYFIYLDMKWRAVFMPKVNPYQAYYPPYGQQPFGQQPPPYNQQPPIGQQQPYNQQPPYGQTSYPQQSSNGQQPPANQFLSNSQPGTKFCGYCGAPALTPNDKFCAKCGKTFPEGKIVIE